MKKISRSLAAVICGAAIVSAASCNAPQDVLTINGTGIRPGIYIINQQTAVDEATSKLREEQPDLDMSAEGFDIKAQTIEGKSFETWVNDKAKEYCRQFVAVSNLYDEMGLRLSNESLNTINSDMDSFWNESNIYAQYIFGTDTIGEYYESVGVSMQSYKDIRINSDKYNALFKYIYGKGGSKEVPEADINAETLKNYAAVVYFIADDGKAQEYVDAIKGGRPYNEVYREFSEASRKAEIEADIKEAEEKGEEYTGDTVDSVNIELRTEEELMRILNVNDTAPSEAFVSDVFGMSAGECKLIKVEGDDSSSTKEYVVKKLDLGSMSDRLSEYADSTLKSLKGEEFSNYLDELGAGYTMTESPSIKSYKLDKLIEH